MRAETCDCITPLFLYRSCVLFQYHSKCAQSVKKRINAHKTFQSYCGNKKNTMVAVKAHTWLLAYTFTYMWLFCLYAVFIFLQSHCRLILTGTFRIYTNIARYNLVSCLVFFHYMLMFLFQLWVIWDILRFNPARWSSWVEKGTNKTKMQTVRKRKVWIILFDLQIFVPNCTVLPSRLITLLAEMLVIVTQWYHGWCYDNREMGKIHKHNAVDWAFTRNTCMKSGSATCMWPVEVSEGLL